MALTLILGGARSGKSDFALQLARASGRPVMFVATMDAGDDELRARVARHRAERPAEWQTMEAPVALVETIERTSAGAFVIIDCATLWVSNLLMAALPSADDASVDDVGAAIDGIVERVGALAAWSAAFDGEVAVVSNEVGSGIVPAYALGRAFRDALGAANRILAARAERVYSCVAGIAVDVKASGTAIGRGEIIE
jgi:adenosyl cobinamide kinase/adenosyl cobinamide phosphate guanylyltransferase